MSENEVSFYSNSKPCQKMRSVFIENEVSFYWKWGQFLLKVEAMSENEVSFWIVIWGQIKKLLDLVI